MADVAIEIGRGQWLAASSASGDHKPGDFAVLKTTPAAAAAGTYVGDTKDAGPAWTSVFGVSGARFASADASAADAAVTDAPASGQKLVITDVLISAAAAMLVDIKEESAANPIASIYLPASGTYQWTPRSKTKLATADKKLMIRTSAAGAIRVTAHYYSEA
jgi:hypothetical protein